MPRRAPDINAFTHGEFMFATGMECSYPNQRALWRAGSYGPKGILVLLADPAYAIQALTDLLMDAYNINDIGSRIVNMQTLMET